MGFSFLLQLHFISPNLQVLPGVFQVAPVLKDPPANAGDIAELALTPGSGRCPGGGHGNPLRYSCLENPMDSEAWQATVLRATENQTRLKPLGACTSKYLLAVSYF